jgi:hypothetical protein
MQHCVLSKDAVICGPLLLPIPCKAAKQHVCEDVHDGRVCSAARLTYCLSLGHTCLLSGHTSLAPWVTLSLIPLTSSYLWFQSATMKPCQWWWCVCSSEVDQIRSEIRGHVRQTRHVALLNRD